MSDPKRKLLTDYHGAQLPGVETLAVELWYPGQPDAVPGVVDRARYVEVGMVCVRATDDVRISYSHPRNGWVIEQVKNHKVEYEDRIETKETWHETAFCPSWPFRDEEDEEGFCEEEMPIQIVVPQDSSEDIVDPFTEHLNRKMLEGMVEKSDQDLLEGEK